MAKRLSNDAGLLDIAGRHRDRTEGDSILFVAATVLDIREHVSDLYKEISEQTLYKHDEEFVPVAIGFKDPDKVSDLQEKIGNLQSVGAALETVIEHLEARFKEAKLQPMSAGGLDNLIDEVAEKPNEIARAISRRAIEILQANPTASLLSAWADETLQLLEVSKGQAMEKSKAELAGLIALKDSLQAEITLGKRIASGYKYPGRVLNQDQVDIALSAMPVEPAASVPAGV